MIGGLDKNEQRMEFFYHNENPFQCKHIMLIDIVCNTYKAYIKSSYSLGNYHYILKMILYSWATPNLKIKALLLETKNPF